MQTVKEEVVIEMDQSKSSKIFLAIFLMVIILSLVVSYWRIVIKRDYDIVASVDCDPYEERCFVHVCNPDPNVDGECAGDLAEDTWFTKNLNRKAYNIPECDPADESCAALQCGENEEGCFYELCGEANVPEGDSCNDPEQYTKDNPPEEDTTCAEGDVECLNASGEEDVACAEGDAECVAVEEEIDNGAEASMCAEGDATCTATDKNEAASNVPATTSCDEAAEVVCPVTGETPK